MVKKLNHFGELYIDGDGHVVIKTRNGNMFSVDDITDLTTIEAKDMLLGPPVRDDEEEEDEIVSPSTRIKLANMKRKASNNMMKKWSSAFDEQDEEDVKIKK